MFVFFLLRSLYAPCLELPKYTEKPFVFIIASYNNSEWYKNNLDSVFAQDYENYRIIYIDDASPDGTGHLG